MNFVVKKCRRVGMADDADSKSVAGNRVRVQVPPPALHPWQGETLYLSEKADKCKVFSWFTLIFLCDFRKYFPFFTS